MWQGLTHLFLKRLRYSSTYTGVIVERKRDTRVSLYFFVSRTLHMPAFCTSHTIQPKRAAWCITRIRASHWDGTKIEYYPGCYKAPQESFTSCASSYSIEFIRASRLWLTFQCLCRSMLLLSSPFLYYLRHFSSVLSSCTPHPFFRNFSISQFKEV